MNTFLLFKTKQSILDHPEDFNMDSWRFCIASRAMKIAGSALNSFGILEEPCHKTESGEKVYPYQMLKLSIRDAARLFYVSLWPSPFKEEWISESPNCDEPLSTAEAMERRKALADIAARRIDHFIATEGRE
jgi:hypothetical protein